MATETSGKKRGLMMEWLPHDVVELILERFPVKSLVRFKVVSKQWKSTIESALFEEKQLKQREESGDPDVLMVSVGYPWPHMESLRTLVLGSSSSVKIPTPWEKEKTRYFVSYHSCDGLVCLYHPLKSGFVVNPATRWYRPLPLCQFQQRMIDLGDRYLDILYNLYKLGFGKDISTGTYKPVWLYNNSLDLEDTSTSTTCEVFDFSTNAWRYVTPAAPYGIIGVADPLFLDGSLHWFTDCWDVTKLVSFDLHTEAFQLLSKAPFPNIPYNRYDIVMCNLDNRLCVSLSRWPNQVIWSFDSANKTWHKIYSIDLELTWGLYHSPTVSAFHPLVLLDGKDKKKKKNLLFYDPMQCQTLLTHDPETQSNHVAFSEHSIGYVVCYFQSLISI